MQPEKVIEVLNDPLAQELLNSSIPARLAYSGTDGFPRVIPIGFLWNGAHFVMGTATSTPKVRALTINPKVALTIDTNTQPPHVLLVRGTASIEIVDGVVPEYLEACQKKYIGAQQWAAFEAQVRATYKQMARIAIVPEWAKLLDFETRLPSFLEALVRGEAGRG
jgi:Pyridoxamine 5'-phosphate oxidase